MARRLSRLGKTFVGSCKKHLDFTGVFVGILIALLGIKRELMKTTLLFAILTAGLNQLGAPQLAELTYCVAALMALMYGGPAVLQAVASSGRKRTVVTSAPVSTASVPSAA